MRVNHQPTRTIWLDAETESVQIINQTKLPHSFEIAQLNSLDDAAMAIRLMMVRGAPLIGATAAFGMWLAMRQDCSDSGLSAAYETLYSTRPTAVNLKWALDLIKRNLIILPFKERGKVARKLACMICDEDVYINRRIGKVGLEILKKMAADKRKGENINILTHCNAGWLATVDWGTATAPIYMAQDNGLPVHVWVDETRPRNQGSSLTAWELSNQGVPHTVIVDNAGGHFMQQNKVDIVIVGADRVTAAGDVCNKIGTYLKALAAKDNKIPFYVALPSPTIDWTIDNGLLDIPIEERPRDEITSVTGRTKGGTIAAVTITPENSEVANPAFDVTPARLISGLITERGLTEASTDGLRRLFPRNPCNMKLEKAFG